jgi:CelD/BcsL family acetyltransferase involved in cellulose biosynthesis
MQTAPSASSPRPEAAGTRTLATTVERTPAALERHLAAWDDLVAHAVEPNPFFEPYALLAAWRHLAAADLEIVLVWAPHPLPRQPPVLAGLFPLVRSPRYKGLPVPVLRTWTHLYSYTATPLVRAGQAGDVLAALFAWLRAEADVILFEWRMIRADGAFHHALIDALNRLGYEPFRDRCHTRAYVRPGATADAYLRHAIGGKKRKELRRQERRLAEAGTLRYDELRPGGDLEAWLDEFIALEDRGWRGRRGTALRSDPAALAAFRALARGAFTRGRWMTLALRLDGRAIAMKCNLRAGDGAIAYKITYDEAFARFSPGVLLEIEQLRRLHEPGAPAWMDSGAAPEHPMIDHLWRDRLAIETLVVPTGHAPGQLAIAAMPLVRWISRTVRDSVQRWRPRPRT